MMREYSITTMEGSCTPQNTAEPSMAGVKNGRPAITSTTRNESATAAAPMRPAMKPSRRTRLSCMVSPPRVRSVASMAPPPRGYRDHPAAAALFAGVISVAGVLYLALAVNLLTAGLAAVTLASYVLLYTPLKRKTTLNTLIGAVPGALPIVGGWTAAGGAIGPAVAAL